VILIDVFSRLFILLFLRYAPLTHTHTQHTRTHTHTHTHTNEHKKTQNTTRRLALESPLDLHTQQQKGMKSLGSPGLLSSLARTIRPRRQRSQSVI